MDIRDLILPVGCYFLGILSGLSFMDNDYLEIWEREKTISDLRFDNSMLREEIETLKQHLSGK